MNDQRSAVPPGLLGDTTARDYARKLQLFNAFAEPELRRAIAGLELRPGMDILDAGCGSAEALRWLGAAAHPAGRLVGMDLAVAHVRTALPHAPPSSLIVQGDLRQLPFPPGSFDLIWCVNTINHLPNPLQAVTELTALLRPGGRIALGQSALLPGMYFAWDARLERRVEEAVRRYYRERYAVDERRLTGIRALVGLLHGAGLRSIDAKTHVIERMQPLRPEDENYLLEAIFRGTWGERLRPYLAADDQAELDLLCDPRQEGFALRRPDFHFLQTFTLVTGVRPLNHGHPMRMTG